MTKRLLIFAFILISALTKVWGDDDIKHVKTGEIDDSKLVVAGDTCGRGVGSITGLVGNNNLSYEWKNAAGAPISIALFATGLASGSYTLTYTNKITGAVGTYGPVVVKSIKTPLLDATNLKIVPAECGTNNGSITGLKIANTGNLITLWVSTFDRSHTYTTLDLVNIPPGTYELTYIDKCSIGIVRYTVPATTGIDLDTSKVIKSNEDCGQKNGSVTGLKIRNPTFNEIATWTDLSGKVWSNELDAKNLISGYYLLTLMYDNLSCPITYGPVHILNRGGPIIDESNAYVSYANCTCENGSITGIKVTGTGKITYEWINSQGYTTSTDLDMIRAKCDAFQLKVSDESGCGPTYSRLYRLTRPPGVSPASPVPDFSKMVVTKGTCTAPASVTGMRWSAITNVYWVDEYGDTVSRAFDLINVPSGLYRFYAEYPCGPAKETIFDLGPRQYRFGDYKIIITNVCGSNTTGALKINNTIAIAKIRWVDKDNNTVADTDEAKNLPPGDYDLYLTNEFGCESFYNKYTVKKVSAPVITPGSAVVTNEQCSSKTGSVKNIKVTGGLMPYHFTWLDDKGTVIDTLLDVKGLAAGTYTLVIGDSGGCTITAVQYQIINDTGYLTAPVINTVNVCNPGDVVITAGPVIDGYKYRLYESAGSSTPIAEETSGKLKLKVYANKTVYVSRAIGDCESPRTAVAIVTGLSAIISNTFSPNGDGINDYWKITGIELYPKASVMIFTRSGQKVFESVGYTKPFDGTFRGKQLASGTYFYVVDPHTGCSFRSGSITIIR